MDHNVAPALPEQDYVSPGLAIVRPDAAFPDMVVGDVRVQRWQWLRPWVEHAWYTDRRNPDAGFVSRDEATILYNAALLVRGKPCLEIGCWRGWSSVHIALGSGQLDIIDPILSDPGFSRDVSQSCEIAGVQDAVCLHAGLSPAAVDELGNATGRRWSLIFIDGDHEGDAPRRDAEAAMRHAADTAMVFFHDLASPFVAAGLDAMRIAGWRTMVYQTMQIMGVAWRGDIEPPNHVPDPRVFWTLPRHLDGYVVCNWKRPAIPDNCGWRPGMTIADRRDAAMMRAQAAEDAASALMLDAARRTAQLAELNDQLAHQRNLLIEQSDVLRTLATGITTWKDEDAALMALARWMTSKRVVLHLIRCSATGRFGAIRTQAATMQIGHLMSDALLHRLLPRRVLIGLARRSRIAGATIAMHMMREAVYDLRVRHLEDLQKDLLLPGSASRSSETDRQPTALLGPSQGSVLESSANKTRETLRRAASRIGILPTRRPIDPQRENVLLVVHATSRTGAPILGWNIARHLADRYNVFLINLMNNGPLKKSFEEFCVRIDGPFEYPWNPANIGSRLRSLFSEHTFKYAIINSFESSPLVEVCARHSIPSVILMHEFASLYPPRLLSTPFRMASEIVFPAEIVAKSAFDACPSLPKPKTRILPQGMCLMPGRTQDALPRAAVPVMETLTRHHNNGGFIVLGAGTVDFRKGVDLFISTAMAVHRAIDRNKVHFVWVGRGYNPMEDKAYSAYLSEQLDQSDLKEGVTFLEELPDLEPIYGISDVLLLTSRLDPLPNVSIDAASRGIPIVCFRGASGTAEILLSDAVAATGVVDYSDPGLAAQAILRLLGDRGEWARVSSATKDLAQSRFDMAKYVDSLDELGATAEGRHQRN